MGKKRDHEKCARQFAETALKDSRACAQGMLLNRGTEPGFGKIARTSVLFVRDGEGKTVGARCVLMHCNQHLRLQEILSSVLEFDLLDLNDQSRENEKDVLPMSCIRPVEPSLDMIDQPAAGTQMDPARFNLDEKMEFICDPFDMDVLRVGGAVAKTAEVLQISPLSCRHLPRMKGEFRRISNASAAVTEKSRSATPCRQGIW